MRVTIGDVTEDLIPFTDKGNKVANIEIVPRKIVEDIIEECKRNADTCRNAESEANPYMANAWESRARAYEAIVRLATGLLNEFEGVDE